jgi:DNA-binding response OmpR family regulator
MHPHILLAIDDQLVCESAGAYLNRNGYLTSTARSREAADRARGDAEFLIVDAEGSAEEALRVCHAVRGVSAVPIIVLSARDDVEERIRGFDAGADDYLVKPFNPRELIGRIKAVSRRAAFARREPAEPEPRGYSFGEWRLDVLSHSLRHSDGTVRVLTSSEFRMLEALVMHAGELVPRTDILQILYGPGWRRSEHGIETRMTRMRRLLRSRTLLRNVYGEGYVLEADVVPDYLVPL